MGEGSESGSKKLNSSLCMYLKVWRLPTRAGGQCCTLLSRSRDKRTAKIEGEATGCSTDSEWGTTALGTQWLHFLSKG